MIIETHSEHFLRRLQRRIAEDQVSKDNVAAYFANAAKVPSVLEPLDIDIYGNIKNWPENFFGDEMGDMIHQADAAAQKNLHNKDKIHPGGQTGSPTRIAIRLVRVILPPTLT